MSARSALIAAGVVCVVAPLSSADVLYGVTRSQLIRLDTSNPGAYEVVGNHGLALTTNGGKSFGSFGLTYDRAADKLYGLHYEYVGATGTFDQSLVEYDLQSGLGSTVAFLTNSGPGGFVESIEYVDSEGALVVSGGLTPSDQSYTQALYRQNLDGTRDLLSVNARDNDYAVYDHTRDLFYTVDPNGVRNLTIVDLKTGTNIDIGQVNQGLAGIAYSEADDAIFGYDIFTGELIRIDTLRGTDVTSIVNLGLVLTEGDLQGLAFVVPSPASLALLGAGGLLVGARRRR